MDIDLHILLMGNEDTALLEQCLQSISDEPVNLRIEPGIKGDSATARWNALHKGDADYVAWVDPDDFIIPGIYQKLLNVVGDRKMAWAKEEVWNINDDGSLRNKYVTTAPHHIHIVHRSLLPEERFTPGSPKPDRWVLELQQKTGRGVFLPEFGYVWRNYPNSNAHRFNSRMS